MRQAIASEFDLALDAVVLIKAGTIPKTSSGKIQRHACREGFLAGKLDMVACWPATASPAFGLHSEPSQASDHARYPAAGRRRRCPALALPPGNGNHAEGLDRPPQPGRRQRAGSDPPRGQRGAGNMTLDSSIGESGLDSLERMEILSTLEERFGGRFPVQSLEDLETPRQLIAAVENTLAATCRPRHRPEAPARPRRHPARNVPAWNSFPNTCNCASGWTWFAAPASAIRTSASTRGSPTIARRLTDGN